ncbi:ester cyclase [Prauserella cavernicola]|uniref:Nuclear transport factor 2 family protein n=1 Tax=Prauserella cavernicola TaxID=2800127 RepID=A0A934V449_9PSEU|nr:nuclear transport factor 2 family protein [Prauserella cavernicola]MBK1787991.1 nuclear transport factor 2 family protein [Prauserella cavernicola]
MIWTYAHNSDSTAFVEEFVDDIWNQQRFERLPSYLHADYRQVDERAEVIVRGRDEYARSVESTLELITDARMRVTHAVCSGSGFAYRWELTGWIADLEVLGPGLRMIARQLPDVRLISMTGMNIARVADGLIVEEINELDPQSVTEQMGWWR